MITTRLAGGLGNQMFQYAAGRRLADHHHTDLTLDISGYTNQRPEDTKWPYGLGVFKVRAGLSEADISPSPAGRLGKLRAVLGVKSRLLQEHDFAFDPHVLTAPDGTYLTGYWQSELNFKDIRPQLLKDFSLVKPLSAANRKMSQEIRTTNAISLHVRRGDYITNVHASKFHGTKGLDYYYEAITMVAAKVESPHFFIFSDDPDWCQQNLKITHPTTYVTINTSKTGYADIHLMSQCQHHIIANSSFSWWGAWLNPNPHKLVIAPKQWFNDTSINTRDIYPKGWRKI